MKIKLLFPHAHLNSEYRNHVLTATRLIKVIPYSFEIVFHFKTLVVALSNGSSSKQFSHKLI